MCALPQTTAVITVYQSDSSSKRPSIVRRLRGPVPALRLGESSYSDQGGIDKGSFHISNPVGERPVGRLDPFLPSRKHLFAERSSGPSNRS